MIFLWILGGCALSYFLFYKYIFLRDPLREIPHGANLVAPASGTVIHIEEITATSNVRIRKGFFGMIEANLARQEAYWLVNIFMSPLDEHFTKMPCDGTIMEIIRCPGKFRAVNTLAAGIENEKQEFLLETKIGLVKIIQIAGLLARRTRSFVAKGAQLKKGENIGVILLGSQTAFLFPKKSTTLCVQRGQKVRAGNTIVANILSAR